MDVHALGSSLGNQREENCSRFKPLYPTGGQCLHHTGDMTWRNLFPSPLSTLIWRLWVQTAWPTIKIVSTKINCLHELQLSQCGNERSKEVGRKQDGMEGVKISLSRSIFFAYNFESPIMIGCLIYHFKALPTASTRPSKFLSFPFQVVWKITDGKKGMNEIQQWLINIQARAPNSPVIIVGTHLDEVKVACRVLLSPS